MTELADYVLEERIGSGGMAEVFRATRKRGSGAPLCVKRMLAGFAADEAVVAMFLDEARLASKLLHPNVVQVLDFGAVDGRPYLVMEHVAGPTLEQLLGRLQARQELLPVEVCVDVAVQLARALEYVHTLTLDGVAQRVVHRDVSPSNVLLQLDGTVKLTDFGLARAVDRVSRTQPGLTKGKCPYMSPEQARAEDVDARADQFAAGIVLWETLTGRRLFDADSVVASLEKVVSAPIPPPSSIRKSVPQALDAIVLRALERSPAARFPSMAAFEHALEQVAPPLGVDDREARLKDEIARVFQATAPTRSSVYERAPEVMARPGSEAVLEVEHGLSVGGYGATAELQSRAIPLEGPARTQRAVASPRPLRRRRPMRAALALVFVVGALGALAAWRFPEELRTLPFVARWLPSPEAQEQTDSAPERALPAVSKPRSARDERKADRLEERGAALLLAGDNRAAVSLLREAAELSPDRASLHEKLAMGYRALGERYLARRHLERFLALSPRASDRARAKAVLEELARER